MSKNQEYRKNGEKANEKQNYQRQAVELYTSKLNKAIITMLDVKIVN